MLREQKGNMYDWVTHTWNPIKGKCEHDCIYCYMKNFKLNDLRLDRKDLKTNLGSDRCIFVGSSTDMFAEGVPSEWIAEVLEKCKTAENKYLFQSKNPERFEKFEKMFPANTILGTTIETNRNYNISKCPPAIDRALGLSYWAGKLNTMVTIEPIMDFDLDKMLYLLYLSQPEWVNIGADSKNHGLPEPDSNKILALINELNKFTTIRKKKNIDRLL